MVALSEEVLATVLRMVSFTVTLSKNLFVSIPPRSTSVRAALAGVVIEAGGAGGFSKGHSLSPYIDRPAAAMSCVIDDLMA